MAAVRETFWMIRSRCWGCKRFRLTSFTTPVAGQLPEDRTTPELSCDVLPEVPILNPDAVELEPRPRRDAATAVKLRIEQIEAADDE
ncbi:Hypothetical predicted protein [Paramuricea clavata]|uniref:Uncharacterized protein n=1 Tax=Paramuricea clavata TaxID=317549 RepID=A0A6S7JWU3_PARCT|nr:Hypothetical predicted protein [Paramuricea clavata]